MSDSDDEIENEFTKTEKQLLDCLGILSYDKYLEVKSNAYKGLVQFGGPFDQALGNLLYAADLNNSIKIMNVWSNEITAHEMLYRIWFAKEKALSAEK